MKLAILFLIICSPLIVISRQTTRSWTKNTFPLLDSDECSFIAREIRMNNIRERLSNVKKTTRSQVTLEGNETHVELDGDVDEDEIPRVLHMCDPDHLWNDNHHQAINAQLAEVSSLSTCTCFDNRQCSSNEYGYSVYVAVMKSMGSDTPRGIGEPPLHESFAESLAHRWNLGHCSDYILIVIIIDWDRVVLHHGDWTLVHKIPDDVKRAMQSQANQMLLFTNSTNVMDYLIVNYRAVLQISANETASLSLLILPYQDLSTGVITVMLLTCVLAVGWTVCLAYLAVLMVKRRRNPPLKSFPSTTATSSSARMKKCKSSKEERIPLKQIVSELSTGQDPEDNSRVQDWIEAIKEHVVTIPKSNTLDDVQSLGKTSSNLNSNTMHTPL